MNTCISSITTLTTDLETELAAFSNAGWRAVELSMEKVESFLRSHTVAELAATIANHDLKPVAAIGLARSGPGLLGSKGEALEAVLASLEKELTVCSALGVQTLGVGADRAASVSDDDWAVSAVTNLTRAGDLAAKHGVRIGVEFMSLNPPIGPFVLSTLDATLQLVKRVADPFIGVNLDLFHHARSGGLPADLDAVPPEMINIVHVCDVQDLPRSDWEDGHRVLPGMGVLPLGEYACRLDQIGFRGYCSLELLNEDLWAASPYDVARTGRSAMDQAFTSKSH